MADDENWCRRCAFFPVNDLLPDNMTKSYHSGNRYLLSSKWPEVIAIPNQEPQSLSEALIDRYRSRFGGTFEIYSDQDRFE